MYPSILVLPLDIALWRSGVRDIHGKTMDNPKAPTETPSILGWGTGRTLRRPQRNDAPHPPPEKEGEISREEIMEKQRQIRENVTTRGWKVPAKPKPEAQRTWPDRYGRQWTGQEWMVEQALGRLWT